MITIYTGAPGSGKSLHAAQVIYDTLVWAGKPVIANFPINRDLLKYTRHQLKKMDKIPTYNPRPRKTARFYFIDDMYLSPRLLIQFARKFHQPRKEHQTLIVIDECNSEELFSNRSWQNRNRMQWCRFFQTHRHWGFDIIMMCPDIKLVDKQIRCYIEYNVKHRKCSNFKWIFKLAEFFLGGTPFFVAVKMWCSINEKCGAEFFRFKKFYSEFYDSYRDFNELDPSKSKKKKVRKSLLGG